MKFEEVLPLMREGKKAQMSHVKDGSYWISCKEGNEYLGMPMILSIGLLNKDGEWICDSQSWAISRVCIMSEDWEIIE